MTIVIDDTEQLTNENCCIVTYAAIREAMKGEPFTMSLTDKDKVMEVMESVNEGIDSYLQACYVPTRGDDYSGGTRGFTATEDGARWKKGEYVIMSRTLECTVSVESLPVLLRRMFERDSSLAASILYCLGFSDTGEYIGRDE